MKKSFKLFCKGIAGIKIMLLAVALVSSNGVNAQEKQSITGKLIEEKSTQAVSFATIALIKASDSKIAGGSMSDENGVFSISPVITGSYILKVSNIGYKPVTRNIEVINRGVTDTGIILLQDISNTGTDVLKLIPGIQIDLMQNVSLEGSPDILIFVDGKERDKSFISQLSPDHIDHIEVISALPSNYDGNISGAINIVLKKDRDSGISGHILAEMPVTSSLVYVFPSYSLNWGFKKLNLYTSYNGELTYLDLHESTRRKVWNANDSNELFLNQDLRQKDWSHRFHYGLDYFLSDKDQLNFYGYYNPYSRQLDGDVYSQISGTNTDGLKSVKEDTDLNTSTLYSLYYKHSFDKKGGEITADISNYFLTAENRTDYLYSGPDENMVSKEYEVKPKQNAFSLRIDYKKLFLDKFIFSTGVKAKLQVSQDRYNDNQLGLQFSGTLKIGVATFNPYIKIFGLQTSGNNIAKYYSIGNKNSMGLESGLSAIVSFKHDIACSLTLQYNSTKYDIQGSSYSDVLYFLSVEKTFKQKIKLGIVTAMPFTRSFTYNGSKINGANFQSTYEGNVIMPAIPFWFKLGFQFNSGKSRNKISREKEEIDNMQKKGF